MDDIVKSAWVSVLARTFDVSIVSKKKVISNFHHGFFWTVQTQTYQQSIRIRTYRTIKGVRGHCSCASIPHMCMHPNKNLKQDVWLEHALNNLFDLTNVLAYFFAYFLNNFWKSSLTSNFYRPVFCL